MAEFDDIEYEGIGGDGHIVVESDRCFRDYSPGDTIISLEDDGQEFYSYPIPSFSELSQSHPGLESNSQQPQSQEFNRGIAESETYSILPPLSQETLLAIQQHRSPHLKDSYSPLTRYRRDMQAHEQRALGIKPSDSYLHNDLETSPVYSKNANGKLQSSEISSLHLSSSPNPTPSTGPGSSSAAEQLRELLGVIESPAWEDDLSPEEQADHLRRATRLKRRVRSERNPRESRPPKIRKRDRVGLHDGKDRQSY
ncbi:hypothetical protein F4781DRAFT_213394 [Annulohypoxylon bovei var. microspora]|nr:hypothetical protein F4781DRAFT_213394 [Annulohypoxylon bovei var. microspora]